MSHFKTYKDLLIWQKGIELVLSVYKVVNSFPEEERFGLISQMKRSAVSIPSNIAEGWGKNSNKFFIQFCYHSRASLMELETQLIIANELNFINNKDYTRVNEEIIELAKMLNSFIKKLKD